MAGVDVETGWRWRPAAGAPAAHGAGRVDRLAVAAARLEWTGLLLVATASVVLFGAVEERHLAPLEFVLFALTGLAAARRWHCGVPVIRVHPTARPLLALAGLGLLQLVPLPSGLAGLLSPGLAALRSDLPGGQGALVSLSVYPYVTHLAVLHVSAYAAFFVLALDGLSSPARVRSALGWAALLGTSVAAYGFFNYLAGNEHLLWIGRRFYHDSVTGTYVNRNNFATLMVLLIPALLACHWTGPGAARRHGSRPGGAEPAGRTVFYGLCGTLMGLALLFSRSRGGIIAGLVSFVAVLLIVRRQRRQVGRRAALLPAALGTAVLLWGLYIGIDEIADRFSTLEVDSGSAAHRTALWSDTLSLAADFPVVGSGLGTYPHVFRAYKTSRVGFAFEHAHNDYLELLADGGLVGLALGGWAIAAVGLHVARQLVVAPTVARLVAGVLVMGIGGALLHSAVDFGLQIPGTVFVLLLLAAVAIRVAEQPELVARERRRLGAARAAHHGEDL